MPPFRRECRNERECRIRRDCQDEGTDPSDSIAEDSKRHASGGSAQQERAERNVVEIGQPARSLSRIEAIDARQQVRHCLVHARDIDLALERVEDPTQRGNQQDGPLLPRDAVIPRETAVRFNAHCFLSHILY